MDKDSLLSNNPALDNEFSSSNEEISFHELIRILWKSKVVILIATSITTTLALIYALITPDIFSTNTIFITKTGNSSSSSFSSLATLAGISLGNSSDVDPSDYLDKVIQDKEFLLKILNKKWLFKGDSVYLDEIWKIEKDTTRYNWKYCYEKLKLDYFRDFGALDISKDKKSGILTLTVNMSDAFLSYDVNNYVIDLLSGYLRYSIKSQAKEKREFIENRINEVKSDLENSENELALFKERNISSSSPKVMLEQMRLERKVTISQEVYLQFQKQYEMTRVEELNDQPLIQIVRNPEIPIVRSKPQRTKIVLIGILIGCIIGFVIGYAKNVRRDIKN